MGRGGVVSGEGLVVRSAVIVCLGVIGGVVASEVTHGDHEDAEEAATQMAKEGALRDAEQDLWDLMNRSAVVNLEQLQSYMRLHAAAEKALQLAQTVDFERLFGATRMMLPERAEQEVLELVEGPHISSQDRVLARFMHAVAHEAVPAALVAEVEHVADAPAPPLWANRLLAQYLLSRQEPGEAAQRYEAEGRHHPEHRGDLAEASRLWVELSAWDTLASKLEDPTFAQHTPPLLRLEAALKTRRWAEAVRWFPAAIAPRLDPGPVGLAAINAVMWLFLLARIGRFSERRAFRVTLGCSSVVLGVFSVVPTLALVFIEDSVLGFRADGTVVRDLFYYLVGVGLREEACKALLAAPVVVLLRRVGTRQDALVMGALVGLGFAAEENINYLAVHGVGTALARFLVSNPLHCFTTGLISLALYDFLGDRGRHVEKLSTTFLTMVGIHGGFDFALSNHVVDGLSYMGMALFLLLVKRFLAEVNAMRRGTPLLPVFINAVATVTAVSFVWACTRMPLGPAAVAMATGLLGEAIIVYAFVQELDRL